MKQFIRSIRIWLRIKSRRYYVTRHNDVGFYQRVQKGRTNDQIRMFRNAR